MAWVKVDDNFTRGRKAKRAARILGGGRKALGRVIAVWLDALSYCNRHLSDGLYPHDEVDDLPDPKPEEVLAAMAEGEEGLGPIVDRTTAGWQFRNYAEYQPTKSEVEAKRAKDRDRKRGKDSGAAPSGFRAESGATPQSQIADSAHPGPARPVPALPDPTEEQPQVQEPAASRRPLRFEFKPLAAVEMQVRKAIHDALDANPASDDSDLVDAAKARAARCHAVGYQPHEITALVNAVRGTRARRMA